MSSLMQDKLCLSMFYIIPLMLIIVYGTISGRMPTCSILEFYSPDLDISVNTTTTNNIFVYIKLDNTNVIKTVKYADPINLTVYYGPGKTFPIGNDILPGFNQGWAEKTYRRDLIETHDMPWEDAARRLVSKKSTVSFRLGLTTTVRLGLLGIPLKKRKMVIGATVEVDDSGRKVAEDGIEFKSSATSASRRLGLVGLLVVAVAFVF